MWSKFLLIKKVQPILTGHFDWRAIGTLGFESLSTSMRLLLYFSEEKRIRKMRGRKRGWEKKGNQSPREEYLAGVINHGEQVWECLWTPEIVCKPLCATESKLLTGKAVHHFLHSLNRACDIKRVKWEWGGPFKEGEISHWELPLSLHMPWLGFHSTVLKMCWLNFCKRRLKLKCQKIKIVPNILLYSLQV